MTIDIVRLRQSEGVCSRRSALSNEAKATLQSLHDNRACRFSSISRIASDVAPHAHSRSASAAAHFVGSGRTVHVRNRKEPRTPDLHSLRTWPIPPLFHERSTPIQKLQTFSK